MIAAPHEMVVEGPVEPDCLVQKQEDGQGIVTPWSRVMLEIVLRHPVFLQEYNSANFTLQALLFLFFNLMKNPHNLFMLPRSLSGCPG